MGDAMCEDPRIYILSWMRLEESQSTRRHEGRVLGGLSPAAGSRAGGRCALTVAGARLPCLRLASCRDQWETRRIAMTTNHPPSSSPWLPPPVPQARIHFQYSPSVAFTTFSMRFDLDSPPAW